MCICSCNFKNIFEKILITGLCQIFNHAVKVKRHPISVLFTLSSADRLRNIQRTTKRVVLPGKSQQAYCLRNEEYKKTKPTPGSPGTQYVSSAENMRSEGLPRKIIRGSVTSITNTGITKTSRVAQPKPDGESVNIDECHKSTNDFKRLNDTEQSQSPDLPETEAAPVTAERYGKERCNSNCHVSWKKRACCK